MHPFGPGTDVVFVVASSQGVKWNQVRIQPGAHFVVAQWVPFAALGQVHMGRLVRDGSVGFPGDERAVQGTVDLLFRHTLALKVRLGAPIGPRDNGAPNPDKELP